MSNAQIVSLRSVDVFRLSYVLIVCVIERPNGQSHRPCFVVFGDACVSERAVVDVIGLVVEAEYARDRHEDNCPERSRSGQLTYLKALGGHWGPLRGPWGVPADPGGSQGGQGAPLESISFCCT